MDPSCSQFHPRTDRPTALATLLVLFALGCDLEDHAPERVHQAHRGPSAPADLQADPDRELGSTTDETSTGEDQDPPPPTSVCGDGVVVLGELCDPGVPPVCGPDSMIMHCAATCDAYTVVPCSLCGNGALDPGEACDGAEFAGESCATQGFFTGALLCSKTCELDTSACHDCGDGIADAGEPCDGADLKDQDCQSLGYAAGALVCLATCGGFDTSGCDGDSSGCCAAGSVCPTITPQACVCAIAPSCCEGPWTEECVAAAITSCGAQCS